MKEIFAIPSPPFKYKTYCFIRLSGCTSGESTLILRKAEWLRKAGSNVLIVCLNGPGSETFKNAGLRVFELTETQANFSSMCIDEYEKLAADIANTMDNSHGVYIESYNQHSLHLATTISRHIPDSKCGLYVIQDKIIDSLSKEFLSGLLSAGIIYSMNDGCINQINKNESDNIPITPIPFRFSTSHQTTPYPIASRIVTVARADVMKDYVLGLIETVRDLSASLPQITFDIVGDGPRLAHWKKQAKICGVEKRCRFLGEVPPHEVDRIISTGEVFVGMGTTLLHAVACSRPSVAVIPWTQEANSHGMFSELPYANLGEAIKNKAHTPASKLLLPLLIDADLRAREVTNATSRLQREFDEASSMQQFVRTVENIPSKVVQCRAPQYAESKSESIRYIQRVLKNNPKVMSLGRKAMKWKRSWSPF